MRLNTTATARSSSLRAGRFAYTRTGLDWTNRYPNIVGEAFKLDCRSAIIDGEAIIQDVSMSDVENEMDVLQRKLATKTREIEALVAEQQHF